MSDLDPITLQPAPIKGMIPRGGPVWECAKCGTYQTAPCACCEPTPCGCRAAEVA